jgi:MOSC domain-containing protein YiiM
VLREGEVGPGDPIEILERSEPGVAVRDVTRLYAQEKHNVDLLRRAIAAEALPESWKEYFRARLAKETDLET